MVLVEKPSLAVARDQFVAVVHPELRKLADV